MDIDNPQLIVSQLSENQLFLVKYDPMDLIAETNIDSINSLKLSKDGQSYPCCCICLEQFNEIAENKMEKLIMTNCKHLYCEKDFQQFKINNYSANGLKCVMCCQKIIQIFELKLWSENFQPQPNQLILNIVNYKSLDLNYFTEQRCKNFGYYCKSAILQCQLCLRPFSSYCIACVAPQHTDFIIQRYQRIIFYCGCQLSLNLFTLQVHEASEIELLHAQYQSNPLKYAEYLFSRIRAYNLDLILKQKEIFCPLCPLKTFQVEHKRKTHIKKRHEVLYHLMYKESVKCFFCKTSFANQQTLNIHKCKGIQAPNQLI